MAGFDDIRRGLAANLAALDGFFVSAYLKDDPTLPALQVAGVEPFEYGNTFRRAGGDTMRFIVEAALPRDLDISASHLLDSLLALQESMAPRLAGAQRP